MQLSLSIIEEYMDETPAAASIFLYGDMDTVLSEFHYKMWASMNAQNIRSVRMSIQDEWGNQRRFERWDRPVQPEPEPEPEPEAVE